MAGTAFVACIERGPLEWQALLLFESIRRWSGAYAAAPIYALSPRAGYEISAPGRRRLDELEVTYIDTVLNTECVEYGPANRVVAAAHVEATTRHDLLVVLDSDTMFLREPAAFALPSDVEAALRPVDVKGMCTAGPGDPNEDYWRRLAELCGTRLEVVPFIHAFVDGARIRASYNGGLEVVRTRLGMLQRCADFFHRSVRDGLRPRASGDLFRTGVGTVAPETHRWWGSSQATLSLAVWSSTDRVIELPPTYNYPLHSHAEIAEATRAEVFERLVHVHYHWLFEREMLLANPLFASVSPLSAEQGRWLMSHLPMPLSPAG